MEVGNPKQISGGGSVCLRVGLMLRHAWNKLAPAFLKSVNRIRDRISSGSIGANAVDRFPLNRSWFDRESENAREKGG
jgi:hypothetical protein